MTQLPFLQFLLLLTMLGLAVNSDLRERRIPNTVTLSGLLAGLLIGVFLEGGIPLQALSGAALALVMGFSIYAFGGMGAGDAKLLMAVGAFVGPGGLFSVLIYAALAGGILALVNSVRRGRILGLLVNTKNVIAYLLTGGRTGYRMDLENPDAQSLPYGPAIAAGALLAWAFPLSLMGGA
jgi:prepilin peptidase CpaA